MCILVPLHSAVLIGRLARLEDKSSYNNTVLSTAGYVTGCVTSSQLVNEIHVLYKLGQAKTCRSYKVFIIFAIIQEDCIGLFAE